MHLHRAQLEYELREKLILLRERLLLAANNKKQLWELMLRFVCQPLRLCSATH